MSFIIISLSLVSYQDSSKVILTSTMAQNKLGRHHDNGKSFSVKSWRRANIVSVCRKSTVNTRQKICGSALLCIVIKHWVLSPAETELRRAHRVFVVIRAISGSISPRQGGRREEVSRLSVGTFSQLIAECCSCSH